MSETKGKNEGNDNNGLKSPLSFADMLRVCKTDIIGKENANTLNLSKKLDDNEFDGSNYEAKILENTIQSFCDGLSHSIREQYSNNVQRNINKYKSEIECITNKKNIQIQTKYVFYFGL